MSTIIYQTIPTATKRGSGLRTDDAANAGGREVADDLNDVDNILMGNLMLIYTKFRSSCTFGG